jgi:myosin heavy subunit
MDSNKDAVPNNLTSLLGGSENPMLRRLFTDSPYYGGQGSSDSEALLSEEREFVINFLMLNVDEGEFSHVAKSDSIVGDSDRISNRAHSPLRGHAGGSDSRSSMVRKQQTGGFVVSEKILTKFKNQLASLMDMVNATDVQYVRCIKPNPNKSSTEYDRRMVVEQLRSAGMIEAVRISRAAYPNRLTYAEFMGRFHLLRSKKWHRQVLENLRHHTPDEQCSGTVKAFLAWLVPDNTKSLNDGTGTTTHYAFGHTKVYFTSMVLEKLEAARNKVVYNHVCAIQKIGRGYVQRKKFQKMIKAVRVIRNTMFVAMAKKQLRKIRNALILIQSLASMRYVRKQYKVAKDFYRQTGDLKQAQVLFYFYFGTYIYYLLLKFVVVFD